MLEAFEKRFGATGARMPSNSYLIGSANTATNSRQFAKALNPIPYFTRVKSPKSGRLSEAFFNTL